MNVPESKDKGNAQVEKKNIIPSSATTSSNFNLSSTELHHSYSKNTDSAWKRSTKMERFLATLVLVLLLVVVIPWSVTISKVPKPIQNVAHGSMDEVNSIFQTMQVGNFCLTKGCVKAASLMFDIMDDTVDPCSNFYKYSCGNFYKDIPVANRRSYSMFEELIEKTENTLSSILENDSSKLLSEAEDKARIYYRSCVYRNSTTEENDLQSLVDILNLMGNWNISGKFDAESWNFQTALENMYSYYDIQSPFKWFVSPIQASDYVYVLQLADYQDGIPFLDQYQNQNHEFLQDYLDFMTYVGVLLGGEEKSTRDQMKDVLTLQDVFAKIPIVPDRTVMKLSNLTRLVPMLDWVHYFNTAFEKVGINISIDDDIVVHSVDYFIEMSNIIHRVISEERGKERMSNYLGWLLITRMIQYLPMRTQDRFDSLKKAAGMIVETSNWRKCLREVKKVMDPLLGAMLVRNGHLEGRKKQVKRMVNSIKHAFITTLNQLSWLEDETVQLAKEKVDGLTSFVGYPENLLISSQMDRKYRKLQIRENEYLKNAIEVKTFLFLESLRKLGQNSLENPVKYKILDTDVFYLPERNELYVPIGLLQDPFYNPEYPESVIRGSLGSIISQNIAFGISGFGGYGKHQTLLVEFSQKYNETAECFSGWDHEPVNETSTPLNNMADSFGLKVAFLSYKKWKNKYPDVPTLPALNLTHEQLLFTRFAQNFCSVKLTNKKTNASQHSSSEFRINGILKKSEDFAKSFSCPQNSSMNPNEKCRIFDEVG